MKDNLTPRQWEVAELAIRRGMSNKAIAREMGLSIPTVRDHISEAGRRLPGDGRSRQKLTLLFLSLNDEEEQDEAA